MTATAKLNQLVMSPANMRQFDKDAGDDLIASIQSLGLIQPLVVKPKGKTKFEVVAGGRRLAALRKIKPDWDIPITVTEADSAGVTLAENFNRREPTPLETWEAIKAMGDSEDLSPGAIAVRLGTKDSIVKKALRLANVHPEILDAFRANKIADNELQAYAATADTKRQLEVFNNLDVRWSHEIKQALGFSGWETNDAIELIGEDAYKAAGGFVERDLFSHSVAVSDEPLLAKLVAEHWDAANKAAAEKHGLPIITNTDDYGLVYNLPVTYTQEQTDRIKEIEDTLASNDEIPEENLDALEDELHTIRDNGEVTLPNDGKGYAIYRGAIYKKWSSTSSTKPAAEKDPLELSQKAKTTLDRMNAERRFDLMGATLGSDFTNLAVFMLARCAYADWARKVDGFPMWELPGDLPKWEWLVCSDEQKAWKLYQDDDATNLKAGQIVAAMMHRGGKNKLVDSFIAKTNLNWESTEEFWKLPRNKAQVLAWIEDFSPHMAKAVAKEKVSRIRELANLACNGGDVSEVYLPKADQKKAQAWIPEQLRF